MLHKAISVQPRFRYPQFLHTDLKHVSTCMFSPAWVFLKEESTVSSWMMNIFRISSHRSYNNKAVEATIVFKTPPILQQGPGFNPIMRDHHGSGTATEKLSSEGSRNSKMLIELIWSCQGAAPVCLINIPIQYD